jgi:hypothetical protein
MLKEQYQDLNQQFFDRQLPPISIRWSNRMTRTAGLYEGHRGRITLSGPLLRDHPQALISTLLHEMIHVWCDRVMHRPQEGHGALFCRKMNQINQSQSQVTVTLRHSFNTDQFARYQARCEGCGRSRLYHRRQRGLACAACCQRSGKGWNEAFLLTWSSLSGREDSTSET